MATSHATSVTEYLKELEPNRREAIERVRQVVLDNLPDGYEEGMQYGMIGYYIPLADYPDTYNGKPLNVINLASQKNYASLYLFCVYTDTETERWFKDAYQKSGKKLNMGKSCVRFKSAEDLPLEVIAEVVSRATPETFIAQYEASRR